MLIIFTNERANFSEFQFCWKISLVGKRTGKSIATLTKKQGKWSVINRRTYYESKAISGLIARILIDIFDSSPGRGEGRGKGGSDRWHACPNDDCSREIGYLHRVIKFLLLFKCCSFKFEREKFRSNKHLFPIDRVLRRVILESLLDEILLKISPRLARYLDPEKTAPQKESLETEISRGLSLFTDDKEKRERERGSPVFHGSLFAKPRRSIQQVNSWIERSKSTCSN